jgi:hypothetical protein
MQIPPMRPTFEIELPLSSDDTIACLTALIHENDFPVSGRIAGNHLMLVIPPNQRHFWSPWLNIEINDHGNKDSNEDSDSHNNDTQSTQSSSIRGRFSPNPSVWTGIAMSYISLGVLVFFSAMFGIAQWMMEKPPNSLKLIPVFVVIAGILYWASLIGQRLAQTQMNELYCVSMEALKSRIGDRDPDLTQQHQ